MELNDLLLKKEEVPILNERNFMLPIYPKLLDSNIRIDPNIASEVFPRTANEWYNDLKEYVETTDLDKEKREWYELFLEEKPKVEMKYHNQSIMNGSWEDKSFLGDNGFATGFSINRDFGGSIYFNKSMGRVTEFVPFDSPEGYICFSEEKVKAFGVGEEMNIGNWKGMMVNVYSLHNVDHHPGALFLRNWGMNYLNEAIKSVF